MSQMLLSPVFKCRGCDKPVIVTHLSTNFPDASGEALNQLMQGLSKIAMCNDCTARYNWLASQGRSGEFHLNPIGELITVRDDRPPQ